MRCRSCQWAILQGAVCFVTAFFLGLLVNVNVLLALVVLIPPAILFIGIGLLAAASSPTTGWRHLWRTADQRQRMAEWTWFDPNLVGGAFKKVAYALPFAHAVDAPTHLLCS